MDLLEGWLPFFPDVALPRRAGEMLADVVRRKGATAESLDGWGWRELKALPVAWCDGLARILTKVEDVGMWPDVLLDAYIAMIPKGDGDATPPGQRPISVLPVVYRWTLGSGLGSRILSLVLGVVVVLLRVGIPLLLTLRRFFPVLLNLMSICSSLMLSSPFIRLIVVSLIGIEKSGASSLVSACLF